MRLLPEEQLGAMVITLRGMTNRQPDGLGSYLGNGHGKTVRAVDLADALEELLTRRSQAKDDFK